MGARLRSVCLYVHAAFVQEGFVPQQPVMQVRGKAVFGAVRACQRKCPQLACCPAFRLLGQVTGDDLHLVKSAHLHCPDDKRISQARMGGMALLSLQRPRPRQGAQRMVPPRRAAAG